MTLVDIAHLNLGRTFYYMYSILDGYSRYIVHWEIREQMTEQEVKSFRLNSILAGPPRGRLAN